MNAPAPPHRRGFLPTDTANGGVFPEEGVIELAYDWPQLSRDEVFGLVQLKIRAGTTGVPNDLERQEVWTKLLPVIQPLIGQIMQFQLQGINPAALVSLLKETVLRFDDKLDLEAFVPNLQPAAAQGATGSSQAQAGGGATAGAAHAGQASQALQASQSEQGAGPEASGGSRAQGLAQLVQLIQALQSGQAVRGEPEVSQGDDSGASRADGLLLPLLLWLARRGMTGDVDGGAHPDRAGQ